MEEYESPVSLRRPVSINVSNQNYNDCFAHALSRVLLKYFKRFYSVPFFEEPTRISRTHEPNNACDDLYLDTDLFFNCISGSCVPNDLNVKDLCQTKYEYNSIILYMFFYGLIVSKYNCESGQNGSVVLEYVISQLYSGEIIQDFNRYCVIRGDYCADIFPILKRNYDYSFEMRITLKMYEYDQDAFFERIKEIIDSDLYIYLNIPESIVSWRTAKKRALMPDPTGEHVIYHAVVILDYDYSDPTNKRLIVKNSWGKGFSGKIYKHGIINIYETDMNPYQNIFIVGVVQNRDLADILEKSVEKDRDFTKFLSKIDFDSFLVHYIIFAINNGKFNTVSSFLRYYGDTILSVRILTSANIFNFLCEETDFFERLPYLPGLLELLFSHLRNINVKIEEADFNMVWDYMLQNVPAEDVDQINAIFEANREQVDVTGLGIRSRNRSNKRNHKRRHKPKYSKKRKLPHIFPNAHKRINNKNHKNTKKRI